MAIITLKDRINSYKDACSHKLMRKVPLVITVNGRGFSRVTSNIMKPFSSEFSNVMCATTAKLCQEIDGAVFGFCFGDDITIIARNDQNAETMPWFQNDIQKIVSAAASIATLEFSNAARSIGLGLASDAAFSASVFAVPNVTEAINVLVSKQQLSFQSSLNFAVYYELRKKYGDEALEMVQGRTLEEKEEILHSVCGITLNSYDLSFRRGIAYYRAPTLVSGTSGQIFKNKWILNNEIPVFTKDHAFLSQIFKSGLDIFRAGENNL